MFNLITCVCKYCNKKYLSDGQKKPKSYKKEWSIHTCYDSTIFCSKECCIKNAAKNMSLAAKKKFINNPKLKQQISKSLKQTYKLNPEIIRQQQKTRKQLYIIHPEIKNKCIAWMKDKTKLQIAT